MPKSGSGQGQRSPDNVDQARVLLEAKMQQFRFAEHQLAIVEGRLKLGGAVN